MIQIVSGTRTPNRLGDVVDILSKKERPYFTILGDCSTGVDLEARDFCQANGWPYVVVHALWDFEGNSAGPKRNQRMSYLAAILQDGCGHAVAMDAFPGARQKEPAALSGTLVMRDSWFESTGKPMMIRIRTPRPSSDELLCGLVFIVIAMFFGVAIYVFFSLRLSFDRMEGVLQGVLP